MKRIKGLQVAALALVLLTASCGRDDDPKGGKGGNATLNVKPSHHLIHRNLVDGKVYIKYNVLDAPTGGYDDSVSMIRDADGVLTAVFSGLKKGSYYLYGSCYDTLYKQLVVGGIPFQIEEERVYEVALPVTENH